MPKPHESIIRNLITLQRLSNGVVGDTNALIAGLFDEMVAKLAKIDPTAPKSMKWQRDRVERWLKLVKTDSREAFKVIHREVRNQVAAIGVHQAEWAAGMLEEASGVGVTLGKGPTGLNIMKSVVDTDFIQGGLMRDWFSGQADRVTSKVGHQIRMAVLNGETIGDMVRRVRGRYVRKGVYEGGVLSTSTREAEAIVRTATNQIATEAHKRVYEENDDIVSGYQYEATLDSRTTPICMALDGQTFKFDDTGAKYPPQHWNCRSTIVPVIEGVDDAGYGTRAAEGGPVPADTTYEGWLRGQSKAKQNEILGPTRANLFRSNKVKLRDLVKKDGSVIRLDDLDV